MKKSIIFDMDGVIFNTEQLCLDCWGEVGEINHFEGIREVALQCTGTNDEMTRAIVMDHYGDDFPYDEYVRQVGQRIRERIRKEGMPVKPGVYELMEYLKKSGFLIGLASSTKRERVMAELQMADLVSYFDEIVCGDMVTRSKPDPQIFLTCAAKLNAETKETYVIEDSYNGITAASRAGMKPIMVPDLLPPTEEIKKLCDHIFMNLLQVRDWLKTMELK